ncbi:hypothetical protein MMC13_003140 [Lambiella insularis]|nr:hypothetical protein [Lambiella insularis]
MATKAGRPVLPKELLTHILQLHTGFTGIRFLWNICRHVSHEWKDIVEYLFRTRHLPKTQIVLRLPTGITDGQISGGGLHLSPERDYAALVFAFDYIRDDHTIATFSTSQYHDQFNPEMCFRLENMTTTEPYGLPKESRHILRLRRLVNDTPIPRCRIEWKPTVKLHCDWRGMVSNLLIEEDRVDKLFQNSVDPEDLRIAYDPIWQLRHNSSGSRRLRTYVFESLKLINRCRDYCYYHERQRRRRYRYALDNQNGDVIVIPDEDMELNHERLKHERRKMLYQSFGDDDWFDFELARVKELWLLMAKKDVHTTKGHAAKDLLRRIFRSNNHNKQKAEGELQELKALKKKMKEELRELSLIGF